MFIPDPAFFHPGSRGQIRSTESLIRIRNTGKNDKKIARRGMNMLWAKEEDYHKIENK
jgi:hypothetical protein